MTAQKTLPSLFLPHGAPDLAISGHPAATFLQDLGARLPRPDGIVIVSAHWETPGLEITTGDRLETIHDFSGFPRELYEIRYPARTARWLVDAVVDCVRDSGRAIAENPARGLDHGAWVPLLLMVPKADIPVVQLSLDATLSGDDHIAVGSALAPLRHRNILVIGSGGVVHNLRAAAPEGSPVPDWAAAYDAWVDQVLKAGDLESLGAFRQAGPDTCLAHPSAEHFLPLLVAAGAGGDGAVATRINRGYSYGSISMSAWAFGEGGAPEARK